MGNGEQVLAERSWLRELFSEQVSFGQMVVIIAVTAFGGFMVCLVLVAFVWVWFATEANTLAQKRAEEAAGVAGIRYQNLQAKHLATEERVQRLETNLSTLTEEIRNGRAMQMRNLLPDRRSQGAPQQEAEGPPDG